MLKILFQNLALVTITGVAAITSGTAITKIITEFAPLDANSAEVREARKDTQPSTTPSTTDDTAGTDGSGSGLSGGNASSLSTNSPGSNIVAATQQFTLATLATHNKSGDCYIAYRGVVYNVSNHPSWQGCTHHGRSGGVDITSVFPHPTTYLSSLPKVGTLIGGSTGTGSGTGTSRSDDDHDDENENEDRKETENHSTTPAPTREVEREEEDD